MEGERLCIKGGCIGSACVGNYTGPESILSRDIVTSGISVSPPRKGILDAYSTFHSFVTGSSSLLTSSSTAHKTNVKNTFIHLHHTCAGWSRTMGGGYYA